MAKYTSGVVRWFDASKGYGYIDAEDGEDVFVHYKDISAKGRKLLSVGDQVKFFLELTVRGPVATDVTLQN